MDTMQMNFDLASAQELRLAWAFAADRRRLNHSRRSKRLSDLRHYVITSCSHQAKALGIRAGMSYFEARSRVPGMKILTIGGAR